jgi:putative two-component system protein, hydrogenase maturation factor HypX/HoxX
VKIHFLTSAHNSLSQRLQIELAERGHAVTVTLATSEDAMLRSVADHAPELIIAPMLKPAIPDAIWSRFVCLIVHPGIKGDRGASSLDWAIMNGEKTWGVTILQATAEMDAGPIWATHEFPLDAASTTKGGLYRERVTEAAVLGVLEAVAKFASRSFQPEPVACDKPEARGRLRPTMRQSDRAIDWSRDPTATVVRKIAAADSAPGVLDDLFGAAYYLYGAHPEDRQKGTPGQILSQRDGAICRATVGGAVWITHLKAKDHGPWPGLKLPAVHALGPRAARIPHSELPLDAAIDYRTFREIRYSEEEAVGYLHFDFYNGAMSTDQCRCLRDAFLFARRRPTRVIVLLGGRSFFSNGIHLNVIEAGDPALESWRNINAIDDLVHEILTTASHLVVAGLRGNAGAGGAMLALAADHVFAREGVVLNPHYKGMGGLYGSEYWTYTLPRRVGSATAIALTEGCRPMGTREARAIGFVDDCFGDTVAAFEDVLAQRAKDLAQRADFWRLLREKHERRLTDERGRPLAAYRAEELERMAANFFGPDPAYHLARRRFVYKNRTPNYSEERPRYARPSSAAPTPIRQEWEHEQLPSSARRASGRSIESQLGSRPQARCGRERSRQATDSRMAHES